MSTNADQQALATTESSETDNNAITDLEPRKILDTTLETDDESCGSAEEEETNDNEYDDEDLQLDVRDAAVDILDQLVELFIEKNGREPNEEEVMQWIDVFKSLKIEDADEATEVDAAPEEDSSAAPNSE